MKILRKLIPYLFISYGIFFCAVLSGQSKNDSAYLKLRNPKYNFGFVKQGTVVKIEYFFENSGKNPLVITGVNVTCGCTVADFPHHPIKQGDTGMILITFNTKEKYDRQDRTVEVISNASNSPTKLRFKGVILENKSQKKDK